jgi:hypothetical protein
MLVPVDFSLDAIAALSFPAFIKLELILQTVN